MEQLGVKEYKSLIKILEEEKETIRKKIYTDEELKNRYDYLSIIQMKLEIQLTLLKKELEEEEKQIAQQG